MDAGFQLGVALVEGLGTKSHSGVRLGDQPWLWLGRFEAKSENVKFDAEKTSRLREKLSTVLMCATITWGGGYVRALSQDDPMHRGCALQTPVVCRCVVL